MPERGDEPVTVQSYETMILIDPETDEERQDAIIARVREIVLAGGTWDAVDPWGRRKLGYEIAKQSEAHHWRIEFSCAPAQVEEVGRVLRITDEVLRHRTVRRRAATA